MLEVIGITGNKGSGKTTLADAIIKEAAKYNRTGVKYSFAKPLKEVCHILFGGSEANWYGDYKTEPMPYWTDRLGSDFSSGRKILQTMGTEIFRDHVHKDFWIMVAGQYIHDIFVNEQPDFIVVDDVRFDNEADFLLNSYISSTIIRVNRNSETNVDAHRSEHGVSKSLISHECNFVDKFDMNKFVHSYIISRWVKGVVK